MKKLTGKSDNFMILKVPFYSQHKDVKSDGWKDRACTMTCLKMAMDYKKQEGVPELDHLVDEGRTIGGFSEHGWTHQAIVLLSHNYGIPAYQEEFRSVFVDTRKNKFVPSKFESEMLNEGIERLKKSLDENRLPIVSVKRNWEQNGTFHSIILIGYELKKGEIAGFYYHDPDTKDSEKKGELIGVSEFISNWRKMAIFIG